jgi:hypothetical protein
MYTYNFIPGQTAVIISGRNRGYVKILLQNEGRYFRNPQYIVQLLHKDPPSAVKVLQSMLHVPRVAENTGVVSFSGSVLRVAHAFVPVLEERHRSEVIISSCIQVEWTFKQQHYLYLIFNLKLIFCTNINLHREIPAVYWMVWLQQFVQRTLCTRHLLSELIFSLLLKHNMILSANCLQQKVKQISTIQKTLFCECLLVCRPKQRCVFWTECFR